MPRKLIFADPSGPFRAHLDLDVLKDTDLPDDQIPRALYCLEAGNVRVTLEGSDTSCLLAMLPGLPLPARVKRLHATDTTATGIVGVW